MASNEWRWTLQRTLQGRRHGLIQSTMVNLPGGPEEYHTNSIRTVCGLQEIRTGYYRTQGRSSWLCDVVQSVALQRSELSSSVFWPDDGPCGCVLQFSPGSDTVQFCRYTATFPKNMLQGCSIGFTLKLESLRSDFFSDRIVAKQNRALSSLHTDFYGEKTEAACSIETSISNPRRLRRKRENLQIPYLK
jgi:hypothetical protein